MTMKNILLTLVVVTLANVLHAQEKARPNKEFTVELSATTIDIKPGESKSVEVALLRSKSYSKSNAVLGLSSSLPEGVQISFEPKEGVIEKSMINISTDGTAKAGSYTVIINSVIQNKSKGKILKIVVTESGTTFSQN
jgi:hypothetical protein